jgi:hypothetical protein
MEKTILSSIENIKLNIKDLRTNINYISLNINIKEEVFREMQNLLIQLEDGTNIINNKYNENQERIYKIKSSGYTDCSKVESYMWSPEWKKVL